MHAHKHIEAQNPPLAQAYHTNSVRPSDYLSGDPNGKDTDS